MQNIFFIITTSLILELYEDRQKRYIKGIQKIIEIVKNIPNAKIIIIENNNNIKTFLDDFKLETFYTENNLLNYKNKGFIELKDIKDCIEHYKINNDDFIVKITGRYIIQDNSIFIKNIKELKPNIDCIIRYGSYMDKNGSMSKINDCVTGLIGMKCKYIKQIKYPSETSCVEWDWAKVTNLMKDENIIILSNLGIEICPCGRYTKNKNICNFIV